MIGVQIYIAYIEIDLGVPMFMLNEILKPTAATTIKDIKQKFVHGVHHYGQCCDSLYCQIQVIKIVLKSPNIFSIYLRTLHITEKSKDGLHFKNTKSQIFSFPHSIWFLGYHRRDTYKRNQISIQILPAQPPQIWASS